jgi:hypothetical protein
MDIYKEKLSKKTYDVGKHKKFLTRLRTNLYENNKSEIRVGFGLRGFTLHSHQPPTPNTTTQAKGKHSLLFTFQFLLTAQR